MIPSDNTLFIEPITNSPILQLQNGEQMLARVIAIGDVAKDYDNVPKQQSGTIVLGKPSIGDTIKYGMGAVMWQFDHEGQHLKVIPVEKILVILEPEC